MPDEPRPSVYRRILAARPRVRASLVVAFAVVSMLGAFSAVASTAASGGGSAAAAPRGLSLRTPPRSDLALLKSLGVLPGFLSDPAEASKATRGWTKITTPTATPTSVPPSPTPTVTSTATAVPVAPTATPRPARRVVPTPTDPPPPSPPPPTATPVPAGPPPQSQNALDASPMDGPSQQLFDMTNKRRIDSGLPPLRPNGLLVGVARIRSRDMADHNYFAHVSPVTGDSAFTLLDRFGVPYGWAGENLAKNNYADADTVRVAEDALWNSPPHRENILNPHYTDMGIALVVDSTGMKYFTIIFTDGA